MIGAVWLGPVAARILRIAATPSTSGISRSIRIRSKARAPALHRLTLLLRLAVGEAGPTGPAADRAKTEALKLLRSPDARAELAESHADLQKVRTLLQAAGLAA